MSDIVLIDIGSGGRSTRVDGNGNRPLTGGCAGIRIVKRGDGLGRRGNGGGS